MPASKFFQCAWAGVRLWLEEISTVDGRDVVVTPFTRGNVPDVDDRGEPPKVVRCELLFDDFPGEENSARDRLEDLLLAKSNASGKAKLFVHPIYGTYLANIVDLEHRINSHGVITASCSFVPAEEVGVFSVDPIGASLDVSVDEIEAAAQEVTEQLTDVEDTSTIPSEATAAGAAIDSASTAREALVELSRISDRIWDEIDEKKLAADVALWPAMRAYVMLGEAVRAATDRSMGDTGAFMTIRVDAPTSLRRLVSEIYGAADADERYDEARELNDIRTPGSVPAGTQLRLRQPART